ncbi:MAG TPA: serine/threonine-protein kinase [bacterium]|nr:serine/threonine-protein kinase [bacterium]
MPVPGDRVGPYLVERPLGRGGEAAVFQGRDLRSQGVVVLKFLEPARLGEVAAYERFRREVAIGRLLRHPGVPRLLEAQEDAHPPFLALEYTQGDSLRVLIDPTRPLPVVRAVDIGATLAEVVAYCHQHRVYHRDLKPENILVSEGDRVTIIDFGIALLEGAPRVTWRGFSGLVGTPEYMAPEQIQGERGGPETDVYALGVILYELLAGRPPFRSANPLSTMYQHLNMDPEPLTRLRRDVPPAVAAAVARAMRRRKPERYATAEEFARALRHPESVDLAVLARRDPPLGAPIHDRLLRHPFIILGLVALGTAALVLVAEFLLRH